jgi:hypothetical protein
LSPDDSRPFFVSGFLVARQREHSHWRRRN